MPTREEDVQTRLRTVTVPTPAGTYNEDWHAYLDFKLVPAGQLAERQLAFYLTLFQGKWKKLRLQPPKTTSCKTRC